MRQQTILILDSQQHRGGIMEHGLTSRGYHVFRTTRSREASKLLHVLQPHFLVVALEGDGRDFYQKVVLTDQVGTAQCVVLSTPGIQGLRANDSSVDMSLPSAQLLDEVVLHIQQGTKKLEPAPEQDLVGDKTVMHLRPFDASAMADSQVAPSVQTPPPSHISQPPLSKHNVNSSIPPAGVDSREWAGTLDKLDVARIFAILARQQASGRLDLSLGNDLRNIWMDRGSVIVAQSTQPILSLPLILVQDGLLHQREVDMHPELGFPGGAQLLLDMGKIQPGQVAEVERWYIEQLMLSCFQWRKGGFHFFPGDTPGTDPKASFPLAPLILQGVREGYDLEHLSLLIGGDRVPQWFANRTPENFLPLQGIEKQIVNLIDGHRSLELIRGTMRVESRILYSLAYVLMILGYIRMRESGSTSYPTGHGLVPGTGSVLMTSSVHSKPSSALTSTVTRPAAMDPEAPMTPAEAALHNSLPPDQPAVSYRSVMNSQRSSARASMQIRPEKQVGQAPYPGTSSIATKEMEAARQMIEQKFVQIMTENYFQVLELTPEALEVDIRRSYQRIKHSFAKERFSPAVVSSMGTKLNEIQQVLDEAYAVVGDSQLRFRYMSNLADA